MKCKSGQLETVGDFCAQVNYKCVNNMRKKKKNMPMVMTSARIECQLAYPPYF